MITLRLNRYYGTPNITKSTLTIEDAKGNVLMECEARESGFADYKRGEKHSGSTFLCLGTGEYDLLPANCEGNAICLRIYKDLARRGFYIMVGRDEQVQFMMKRLQLGRGTSAEPKYRLMTDFAKVREEFQQVLYDNYVDEFRLVVSNEGIEAENE